MALISQKWICAILLAVPAMAGENVVLSSGFRIHAQRHELDGDIIRIYTNQGVTELPTGAVSSFEEEEYAPPPVAPAQPAAAPAPIIPAVPVDPKTLVHNAALRSGLPPAFVESVAKIESAMHPDAVSPKGAIGVMQLMPSTAKSLAADPADVQQNIDAGTRLLRDLLIKYDGDVVKALAAYNSGEGAVDRYRGLPPYRETQNYVNKVIQTYQQAGGK